MFNSSTELLITILKAIFLIFFVFIHAQQLDNVPLFRLLLRSKKIILKTFLRSAKFAPDSKCGIHSFYYNFLKMNHETHVP